MKEETGTASESETETASETASETDSASQSKASAETEKKVPRASLFPLPMKVALPLAFAEAFLYFIAFPGIIDKWPTVLVTFTPLLLAWHKQSVKRATWIGLFAGFIMSWEGFWWLNEMLRNFSGFNVALCALFTTILCAFQAGRYGFMGWLYARANERGWPAPLVACGAFVASEQVFPLLFPWYLADCVHSTPIFAQSADIGGPVFCGLLLFGSSLALFELVVARLEKRPIDQRVVVGGFLATALSAVYGFVRVRQVDAQALAGEPVHVGFAQGNLGLMQNYTRPDVALSRHLKMTRELQQKGVELAIWSESSVMYGASEGDYKDRYKQMVGRLVPMPLIFGGMIFEDQGPERAAPRGKHPRVYNTAIATNAHGDVTGRYDKEFLLAFGEYLPFGETFPVLYEWSPNSGHFTPGTSLDPVSIEISHDDEPPKTHPVSVLICYEDIIQSFVNRMVAHANPELLVNMTNDAWFGDTSEPWEHLALSQFRAVEHHRYFVRATNSGVSAIIDPVGRVLVHSGTFRQDTGDAIVHWMRSSTIYETVGDAPVWTLSALAVAAAFVRRKRVQELFAKK